MRKAYTILLVCSCLFLLPAESKSQSAPLWLNTEVFRSDSIESIKKTSISSLREINVDDIAFNIIILSKEEIQASGARDLLELLLLIPGFSAGIDVDEVIGLGMRGQWAHEGKYLIMLNNIPLNELDFGTFSFGQRVILNNVDRIEIILGPGSVIYGGTAELGVINVVTNELGNTGANAFLSTSANQEGITRTSYGLSGKHFLGNETYITYNGSFSEGGRSNYVSNSTDGIVNYLDSTQGINAEIFMRLRHKNISLSYLYNNYVFNVTNAEYGVQMMTNSLLLDYKKRLSTKHSFFARSVLTYQLPWTYKNTTDPVRLESNTRARSFSNTIHINSKLRENLQSTIGIQLFRNINMGEDEGRFNSIRLWNIPRNTPHEMYGAAAFGDASLQWKKFTFQGGFRSEINNNVNAQFTPRFGLTAKLKDFLVKLNYSNAYKIPTLQNLSLGPEDTELKTEISRNLEASLQYKTRNNWSIGGSLYHISIFNPIVYVSDAIVLDRYINRSQITTYGFDASIQYNSEKNSIRVGYNLSRLQENATDLPEIEIENSNVIQGLPNQAATVIFRRNWSEVFSSSLSYRYQGSILTYDYTESELGVLKELNAVNLLNLQTEWNFKKIQGLVIQIGITNLFNQSFFIASPYNYGTDPFPLLQRQYTCTIKYELFK